MKIITCLLGLIILLGCRGSVKKANSIELINAPDEQVTLFRNLIALTGQNVSGNGKADSLAFLVLPVQASCPSCRNKTIDSIVKHQDDLRKNHFIIISAKGGRKTINGYFQENNKKLPDIRECLVLDSANMAYEYDLYNDKPVMYYAYNQRVYKKVSAVPSTVRDDLREFFSGHR